LSSNNKNKRKKKLFQRKKKKFADEVIIGAPLEMTKAMIDALKIQIVATGSTPHSYNIPDSYKVKKKLN
jgi:glycerol-3-phosphate cytidylyltransferase-like family protein